MEEMAEVGDSNTTETTEINKFMVRELPPCSLCKWQKTNPLSRLSAILATLPRLVLDVVEPSPEDVVNVVAEVIQEVAEDNSKGLVDEVDSKVMVTIAVVAEEVHEAAEDLDGKTTISHKEIVMPLSISSPTGKC